MYNFIKQHLQRHQAVLIFSAVALVYIFDIGNLDGIRQGTEALYVQISKEMYEAGSFLTPLYRGEAHWSKPPLQFWLPFPFYFISGGFSLTAARLAMAVVGLAGALFMAFELKKWKNISFLSTFLLLAGNLGILKFSRTFMMEIPLAILPVISLFLYWDFIQLRQTSGTSFKNWKFLTGALLLGLSVLVKGPVTLVMAFIGLGLYQIFIFYKEKKSIFWESFYFFLLATFVASIWFVLCYIKYGQEFFNEFFLKENVGKFGVEKMPAIKIVEGLVLYALPWVFALPLLLANVTRKFKEISNLEVYLLSLFLGFFIIWFFPAQKSHHYALPALPFFLTYILVLINEIKVEQKYLNFTQSIMGLLFVSLLLVTLYFVESFFQGVLILFGIAILAFSIHKLLKNLLIDALVLQGLTLIFIWVFILPIYFLPMIPSTNLTQIKKLDTEFYLADRRSYFFEENLDKPVLAVSSELAKQALEREGTTVFVYHSRLGNIVPEDYKILFTWKKWHRMLKFPQIKEAFATRSLEPLKESVYVLQKK